MELAFQASASSTFYPPLDPSESEECNHTWELILDSIFCHCDILSSEWGEDITGQTEVKKNVCNESIRCYAKLRYLKSRDMDDFTWPADQFVMGEYDGRKYRYSESEETQVGLL